MRSALLCDREARRRGRGVVGQGQRAPPTSWICWLKSCSSLSGPPGGGAMQGGGGGRLVGGKGADRRGHKAGWGEGEGLPELL